MKKLILHIMIGSYHEPFDWKSTNLYKSVHLAWLNGKPSQSAYSIRELYWLNQIIIFLLISDLSHDFRRFASLSLNVSIPEYLLFGRDDTILYREEYLISLIDTWIFKLIMIRCLGLKMIWVTVSNPHSYLFKMKNRVTE